MTIGHAAAAVALASVMLAACEPTQLYIGSRTVVGINASVNPEQGNGSLVIGADRTFVTLIPRSVEAASGSSSSEGRDAMSALACSDLAVEQLTIRRFSESLATGQAARDFASRLHGQGDGRQVQGALRDFFDCFRDRPQPTTTSGGGGE